MFRNFLAVLVGLVAATAIVFGADQISHLLHPPPQNLSFSNREAIEIYMLSVPFPAFLPMFSGWIFSSFLGAFVAAKISLHRKMVPGLITGGILFIGAMVNLFSIPHPMWMMVGAILLYMPAAFLGGKLGSKPLIAS
jgi:sorbitol-specific phosphotransferase system component IIBC